MANSTKILKYDLDEKIQELLGDLITFQGTYSTLIEKLEVLDAGLLDEESLEIVNDLIDAYNNDFKGHMSERVRLLEEAAHLLSDEGNTEEQFIYDAEGNVIQHVCTGDREFTVDYSYKSDGSGEITSSTKTYTKANGDTVKVKKTYTYTDGDISGVKTETTTTPGAGA